jgi:hypothetical protein
MKRSRAPVVKNLLAQIIGDGLTTGQIITLLRKNHGNAIDKERDDLIDIGLSKLVNQVGALQSGPVTEIQTELFEEYNFGKKLNVVVNSQTGPVKVWRDSTELSIEEAKRYIADHQKPTIRELPGRAKELQRFLKDYNASSVSPSTKLIDLWRAARKGG